jgi:hypothetical protein
MSDIKNPSNQVHRAADGNYHVMWRGVLVNGSDGRMRQFPTEAAAQAYLAQCEAEDRATGPNPAPHGVQTFVPAGPRRSFKFPT